MSHTTRKYADGGNQDDDTHQRDSEVQCSAKTLVRKLNKHREPGSPGYLGFVGIPPRKDIYLPRFPAIKNSPRQFPHFARMASSNNVGRKQAISSTSQPLAEQPVKRRRIGIACSLCRIRKSRVRHVDISPIELANCCSVMGRTLIYCVHRSMRSAYTRLQTRRGPLR